MDSSIIQCINVRKDFFEKYYSVPEAVRADADAFVEEMYAIGHVSRDATEFEAKFALSGLQERMNSILVRCTPRPYKMTAEEKQTAKETAKEIFREDRSRILREAAVEAVDFAAVMAEEEIIAKSRRTMIDAGVHDDYTRASNAADMVRDPGGFFKSLFRRNK